MLFWNCSFYLLYQGTPVEHQNCYPEILAGRDLIFKADTMYSDKPGYKLSIQFTTVKIFRDQVLLNYMYCYSLVQTAVRS